ncbi:unnamed protein product [Camellia sinensis]
MRRRWQRVVRSHVRTTGGVEVTVGAAEKSESPKACSSGNGTLEDKKLRESISQDQEKTEALKSQIQELERNIQNVDAKIQHNEVTLKDLRKLEDQISTKTAKRSTLFEEKEKQFAALAEENQDTDEQLEEWKIKLVRLVTDKETGGFGQ